MNFTSKEKKIRTMAKEQAKQIDYGFAIKAGSEVKTWSATHTPAYGSLPVERHKICLCCQKQWPVDTDRTNCDCQAGGRLYDAGMIYQKKVRQ